MAVISHPQSGVKTVGLPLGLGAILKEGDLYDSTNGTWSAFPSPGLTVRNTTTLWVRPGAELSQDAQHLLAHLSNQKNWCTCIAERYGSYYLIPSPSWNWDGRIGLPRIQQPECVDELIDLGYLASQRYVVSNWESDFAMSSRENQVYTITAHGQAEAVRLVN